MEKKSTTDKQNSLFDQIKLMKTCPLCSEEYIDESIALLEEGNSTKLMHLTCMHCHNAMLALIVTSKLGMSSVGMLTDLNVSDVHRLRRRRPLSEDDILGFHEGLKLYQKEFIQFLTH